MDINLIMFVRTHLIKLIYTLLLLLPLNVLGQVRLPKLVSDGMVLQRDASLEIWGWASAKEKVTVKFLGKNYQAVADESGNWEVKLPSLKAGGPYTMTISGSNSITLQDILIGDVWVCSGQSNMELPMRRVKPLYEKEIEQATNANIRYFDVPQKYNFEQPQTDLEGGRWQKTTPENVMHFSAVAYFFAQELYNKYKVPVGLLHAALGGSPVESWISEEALKPFPKHYQEVQRFKDAALIAEIEARDNARSQAWYQALAQNDKGNQGPKKWHDPDLPTSNWSTMQVPGYWADTKTGPVNGIVWFRKEIELSADEAGKKATLNMGRIVDADSVFVNGRFVGSTGYQYPPRWYTIPEGMLKAGKNTISVKIINERGRGGFVSDKPYELTVGDRTLQLTGDWQYQVAAENQALKGPTFIRWKPAGLYNAMIAPLAKYSIKGAIWYQGESNVGRAQEYQELFPAMIKEWRSQWGQGDLPFLYVQLTNYLEPKNTPSESDWAQLREAQRQTLSVPNTGMAVAIDLGEWNDIHPLNKKDVAKRLALAAQRVAYGDNKVVYTGPTLKNMQVKGKEIILTFNQAGAGLVTKGGGELNQFAIAGPDKRYVWANARIKGNKVIVWHKDITNPVSVRYAWADNPEGANLYNAAGLPASPFQAE
ncbi:sialate O-acetylesterase [Pontibacter sp. 13R65]|uniref:sialate O-acetylesterase n=1 Tax=Pontibacter sp. 13R65 TaxID=3127458 RepID=UPI00301D464C